MRRELESHLRPRENVWEWRESFNLAALDGMDEEDSSLSDEKTYGIYRCSQEVARDIAC